MQRTDEWRLIIAAALERCGREREELLAQPFSVEASRRVEALDALTDQIWLAFEVG